MLRNQGLHPAKFLTEHHNHNSTERSYNTQYTEDYNKVCLPTCYSLKQPRRIKVICCHSIIEHHAKINKCFKQPALALEGANDPE